MPQLFLLKELSLKLKNKNIYPKKNANLASNKNAFFKSFSKKIVNITSRYILCIKKKSNPIIPCVVRLKNVLNGGKT